MSSLVVIRGHLVLKCQVVSDDIMMLIVVKEMTFKLWKSECLWSELSDGLSMFRHPAVLNVNT